MLKKKKKSKKQTKKPKRKSPVNLEKKKSKKNKKYLLTIKLLYINPNILSTAKNILVQQQDLR